MSEDALRAVLEFRPVVCSACGEVITEDDCWADSSGVYHDTDTCYPDRP